VIISTLRPGDILITRSKLIAILLKQTKSYWYYHYKDRECRVSKQRLWRHLDLKKVAVSYGPTMKYRRKQKKDRTLDLHGMKHTTADDKVRMFLNFVELPTRIITGHSKQMKDIVYSVVEEYGWTCAEDPSNSGEILIFGD